jgi:hypothetical protein
VVSGSANEDPRFFERCFSSRNEGIASGLALRVKFRVVCLRPLEMNEPVVSEMAGSLLNPSVFQRLHRPNKSPEPTVTAVTPRAVDMHFRMKQSNLQLTAARVAPSATVAHL